MPWLHKEEQGTEETPADSRAVFVTESEMYRLKVLLEAGQISEAYGLVCDWLETHELAQ